MSPNGKLNLTEFELGTWHVICSKEPLRATSTLSVFGFTASTGEKTSTDKSLASEIWNGTLKVRKGQSFNQALKV